MPDRVQWPSLEDEAIPDAVFRLADSVQGIGGGWFALRTVGPGRPASTFGDPAIGLDILRADLGRVCTMQWIDQDGVCRSLQAKLSAASAAVVRRNTAAARGQVAAFLAELEAQHGPQPGKHVSGLAYALLSTLGNYLLQALPR